MSDSANAWTCALPWIDRDDADIDAYIARLRHQPNYDLGEKLRRWRDEGIVQFQNVVSDEVIEKTLADLAHLHERWSDYRIPIEVRGNQIESDDVPACPLNERGVKLNHLHCFSRAAARLSLTAEVVDFLGHVFGAPPAVLQSLTFWRGSEQPIHIDYPYVREQKRLAFMAASWTPLEDIHPDSGPLGYYPGGHKVETSGFFDWGDGAILYDAAQAQRTPMDFAYYLWDRMKINGVDRVDFCPKRGDVLLWHGNLPHEGTKVVDPERTRKSFVAHYTSLDDLPQWMRAPAAHSKGLGVFENGGHAFEFPWLTGRAKLPSWRE